MATQPSVNLPPTLLPPSLPTASGSHAAPGAHPAPNPPTAPNVPSHNPNVQITPSGPPSRRKTYHEPTEEEKILNPAKYLGYRVFSRWIASDPTYFIVRKFAALNARTILALQDEIVELEQELKEYDEDWSRTVPLVPYPNAGSLHNGTFRTDHDMYRVELIRVTIADKLQRYNQYVNDYASLAQQAKPNPRDIESVRLWLYENHEYAIERQEADYINYVEDLIAVQPKIKPWFRSILERTRFLKIKWFICFRRTPRDSKIIDDGDTFWPNDGRIDGFSALVIALTGMGMLVGPLWWLNYVENQAKRLGIITGFTATFFVLVHVGTRAKVSEALASAAAYSAVLVVFLQLQAPDSATSNASSLGS